MISAIRSDIFLGLVHKIFTREGSQWWTAPFLIIIHILKLFLGESMIFLNHKSHKHTMIWMYVLQRSQKNEVSIIFINGWNWNCAKNFISKKKCTKAPSSTETPPKSDLKDWNVNTTSISATYLSRVTQLNYIYISWGQLFFFFGWELMSSFFIKGPYTLMIFFLYISYKEKWRIKI